MAFNAQLPSSFRFERIIKRFETPITGYHVPLCFCFAEKVCEISNPITLRHDILHPNVAASFSTSNAAQLAVGCKGHQVDRDFPLEPRTPFSLPLVMFPTKTNGNMLHEVDLCAEPVINWELYVNDLRISFHEKHNRGRLYRKRSQPKNVQTNDADDENVTTSNTRKAKRSKSRRGSTTGKVKSNDEAMRLFMAHENKAIPGAEESLRFHSSEKLRQLAAENAPDTSLDDIELAQGTSHKSIGGMTYPCWKKLYLVPPLRVEATWNHLFGGYNGACCYVEDKKNHNCYLFTGKGSQLRSIKLSKPATDPDVHSIFSYSLDSIWEETPRPVPYNSFAKDKGPFNDLIFQIVANEHRDLLGVRRGKSVQIYSIDEETPYILETVPNIYYNTSRAGPARSHSQVLNSDPLLTGVSFNPKYSPEIVTSDDNGVVRVCDISEEATISSFLLPKEVCYDKIPTGYQPLHGNQAIGVAYSSVNHLILGWRDSVVSLCDRRESTISCPVTTLMDLRNDDYFVTLSHQNIFHDTDKPVRLSEYVSCVKETPDDLYYYVGTSSKVYLMDLRVPNKPVFRVSHGLQSPLAYMDITSDENYDRIVGASQRCSETVCLLMDRTHTGCIDREGCSSDSPVLHCYPKHLSNPRAFFDLTTKEGFDFPCPSDHDLVKDHCYAWPTGLSVFPSATINDPKIPAGFIVATSNNFGDVFLQEWNQKPNQHKLELSSDKMKHFMSDWRHSMTPKLPNIPRLPPSKSALFPDNVSLLIEPLAEAIETLIRVRSKPFDCFNPNQLQHVENMKTMLTTKDLFYQLRRYKNPKVKTMVNIWDDEGAPLADPTCPTIVVTKNQPEHVEVKIEPVENAPSLMSTINLDESFCGELDEDLISLFENSSLYSWNGNMGPSSKTASPAGSQTSQMLPPKSTKTPKAKKRARKTSSSSSTAPSKAGSSSSAAANEMSVADAPSPPHSSSSQSAQVQKIDPFKDEFFTEEFSENYSQEMFSFPDRFNEGPTSSVFHSQEELFTISSQQDVFLSNLPSTSSQSTVLQSQRSQSQKPAVKRRKSGFL